MPLSRDPFEPLIQALHHSSGEGRWKAAEALRQRGEPGGQLSAETLIHVLLHDTTPLRQAAAEILREWREYAPVEPLFLAMQDADGQVRSAAKWALAEVGEYAQQESLLSHLADADSTVRAAVLYALGTRAPRARRPCATRHGCAAGVSHSLPLRHSWLKDLLAHPLEKEFLYASGSFS
jgi:hypothetical protein